VLRLGDKPSSVSPVLTVTYPANGQEVPCSWGYSQGLVTLMVSGAVMHVRTYPYTGCKAGQSCHPGMRLNVRSLSVGYAEGKGGNTLCVV
jgi:hypothetical protein